MSGTHRSRQAPTSNSLTLPAAGDASIDDDAYGEDFEDEQSELKSQGESEALDVNTEPFTSSGSNPLFGDDDVMADDDGNDDSASAQVSRSNGDKEPHQSAPPGSLLGDTSPDDADFANLGHADLAPVRVAMAEQGSLQQPFTPTAPSLFSASDHITDDVDAFNKTLCQISKPSSPPTAAASPAVPEPKLATPASQGLARVRSGLKGVVDDSQADLTPAYRHQVRSLGQATDNEQAFR